MAKSEDTKTKKSFKKFYTPVGVFKYPRLNEPDHGTEDYPKDPPEYNVKLILDAEAADKMRDKLQDMYDEAVKDGKKQFKAKPKSKQEKAPFRENPYLQPVYEENEEGEEVETGDFEMSFKMKAEGKSKKTGKPWSRTPLIMDSKKNKINAKKVKIGGGTRGQIAFTVNPYFIDGQHMAGLSLQLEGVRIIELVQGGGANPNDFAFDDEDEVEDGFTVDDIEEDDDDTDDQVDTEEDDEDEDEF